MELGKYKDQRRDLPEGGGPAGRANQDLARLSFLARNGRSISEIVSAMRDDRLKNALGNSVYLQGHAGGVPGLNNALDGMQFVDALRSYSRPAAEKNSASISPVAEMPQAEQPLKAPWPTFLKMVEEGRYRDAA